MNIVTNKLLKASILKKMYGYPILFNEQCTYGEDFYFTLKYFINCNKAVFIDYKLYYNRKRIGSAVQSKFNEKKLSILNEVLFLDTLSKKDYPKANIYLKARKCDLYSVALFLISNADYNNKEIIKNAYNGFKTNLRYCFKCNKAIMPIKYFMWCKWPYFYFKLRKRLN